MDDTERITIREAAKRIVQLIADVRMPTVVLSQIMRETTRLTLLAYGDLDPEVTMALVGATTAGAYAEGESWARAVIDGPDDLHTAMGYER